MAVDHAREPPFERLRNDVLLAIGALSAIENPMLARIAQGLHDARPLVDALTALGDAAEALGPDAVARLVSMAEYRKLADAIVAFRTAFAAGGYSGKV